MPDALSRLLAEIDTAVEESCTPERMAAHYADLEARWRELTAEDDARMERAFQEAIRGR